MSKNKEQDIEQLLRNMPTIEDEKSSEEYYSQIHENMNPSRSNRKKKQKTYFYPILGSVAALFIAVILLFQFLPGGDNQFNEGSSEMADDAMDQADAPTDDAEEESISEEAEKESEIFIGESNEERDEGQESVEAPSNDTEEEEPHFSRLLQPDETNENEYVTYFFPDAQAQLLVPVTFSHQANDSYEAFNQANELTPNDFKFSDQLYQFMSFIETDEEGDPVVQIDVEGIREEFSGGTPLENNLISIIDAYFAQLNEDRVKIENTEGERVSFSHTGELDRIMTIDDQHGQLPYKLLYVNGEENPFYVPVPDFSGSSETYSFEEAIVQMNREDEYSDAIPSLPEEWTIDTFSHSDQMVEIRIEGQSTQSTEDQIMGLETILLTAKSFGYDEVTFQMEGIQQIGQYSIGTPISVPAYVNPN